MNQSCKWLIDEMQDDSGGYYSTIDADSENVEGKYYAWSERELLNILTHEEYVLFKNIFSVYNKPNLNLKNCNKREQNLLEYIRTYSCYQTK